MHQRFYSQLKQAGRVMAFVTVLFFAAGVEHAWAQSASCGDQASHCTPGACPSGYVPKPACNSQCLSGMVYCDLSSNATSGSPSSSSPASGTSSTSASSGKCGAGFSEYAGVCFPTETGLSEASIWDILFSFAQWLLAIFGIVATLAFIISGFQYLLSAGDEDAIDTAKRNMTYAVVGVIVALGSYVIITAVSRALNAVPLF